MWDLPTFPLVVSSKVGNYWYLMTGLVPLLSLHTFAGHCYKDTFRGVAHPKLMCSKWVGWNPLWRCLRSWEPNSTWCLKIRQRRSHEIILSQVLKCSWHLAFQPLDYSHRIASWSFKTWHVRHTSSSVGGVRCVAGLFLCCLETPTFIYLYVWCCSDTTHE